MTEVRVRHAEEYITASLGDVPFLELERVIPLLRRNGIVFNGDCLDGDDFCGEFKFDHTGIYFEVLVG